MLTGIQAKDIDVPIDPTNNNSISRLKSTTAPESSQAATRSSASAASTRAADQSSHTANIHSLNTQDATRDVDVARVAEIRQGIADGSLTFDSGRIADGIIASARELTGDD